MCLENKMACLGFGNLYAAQVTRLRQCFFEAGLDIPNDLADTPTEEDMCAFLICLRDALRDEHLVLRYSGTKCAGSLVSMVLAMCPEDVWVEVNGETVTRGCRDSVMFSITSGQDGVSNFHVERVLRAHTKDFHQNHIVEGKHVFNQHLHFSWNGMLSSQVDIALAIAGAKPSDLVKQALADLVATMTISFSGAEWAAHMIHQGYLPSRGFKTLLGPMYRQVIEERLSMVLCRPSKTLGNATREYDTLHHVVS
jgi:hypothetical protein